MSSNVERRPEVQEVVDPDAFPIEMSADVPADTGRGDPVTKTRTVPFDGRISGVILGWPNGAQGAAGLNLGRQNGSRWVPFNSEDRFIAKNDFTERFNLRVDVDEGLQLLSEFVNNDPNNPHFLTITVELEERVDPDDARTLRGRY